jgi:predicted outer membrane repeat protein
VNNSASFIENTAVLNGGAFMKKDISIIVKDVYKPVTEAERRKALAKSISKLIKIKEEKKIVASTKELGL